MNIKPNLVDKLISFISPSAGLRRLENRAKSEILLDNIRSYEGASRTRRGANWNSHGEGADPNFSISMSLPTLRERSRALYKNNGYARKAIETIALSVVGTGIQPSPLVRSKSQSRIIKDAWREFAGSKACDFYGRVNIYALQMQAMKAVAMSGECLVLRKRDRNSPALFTLQVLDGDMLDINRNYQDVRGTVADNYTVQGVEFDRDGRRVAYWIYERPPSNTSATWSESKRIPAEDVLHIFVEDRPGQARGVPFLTPVMLAIRDAGDYEDAQLMRQKVAACFSVFITQAPTVLGTSQDSAISELSRVEPGIIERLPPGEEVKFASPPGAEGYPDYMRKVLQGIAAGSGISYESMTGDLTGVNFSSGRMGWIEAHKQTENLQYNMFIPLFCDGVWKWFMEGLMSLGRISKPAPAEWTPPRRYMIDPAKEIKGIQAGISSGLMSWSEAIRGQGYDPDTVLQEIKEDKDKISSAGVSFDWSYNPQVENGG